MSLVAAVRYKDGIICLGDDRCHWSSGRYEGDFIKIRKRKNQIIYNTGLNHLSDINWDMDYWVPWHRFIHLLDTDVKNPLYKKLQASMKHIKNPKDHIAVYTFLSKDIWQEIVITYKKIELITFDKDTNRLASGNGKKWFIKYWNNLNSITSMDKETALKELTQCYMLAYEDQVKDNNNSFSDCLHSEFLYF